MGHLFERRDKGQKSGRAVTGRGSTASSVIQPYHKLMHFYKNLIAISSPNLLSLPQHVCKNAELGTLLSPLPPLACHASSIKLHKSFASLSFNGK